MKDAQLAKSQSPTSTGNAVATGLWPDMRQPTSLGINIPNSERALFNGTPHYSDMLAMSKSAAASGFDVLWFDDHFSFTSDTDLRGAWDAWTLMAAIATQVPDIYLGPMVACTAYRNPGVIAKMTEMIQDISGGRFILGLGAGWHKPEYDQFGIRFEPRVSQFEEALMIIHEMIRDGEVDFQGEYYQANKAVNLPRSAHGAETPILVGSSADRMLKSLVRYADAWNTGGGTAEELRSKIAKVDTACEEAGRDPKTVVRTSGHTVACDPAGLGAPTDGVDAALETLRMHRELGFQHVMVRAEPSTPENIASLAPVVEAFYLSQ
jgi:alkanesulfonate monooxygenase SsuD/methylene tetrahydromethanopterin reductase-like flavin-dependent oxidoreductase (luciferase family)